jgi:hypothetical protein
MSSARPGRRGSGATVRDELSRLVELGTINKLPSKPGSRRQYDGGQEHPLWEVVKAAIEAAEENSS